MPRQGQWEHHYEILRLFSDGELPKPPQIIKSDYTMLLKTEILERLPDPPKRNMTQLGKDLRRLLSLGLLGTETSLNNRKIRHKQGNYPASSYSEFYFITNKGIEFLGAFSKLTQLDPRD